MNLIVMVFGGLNLAGLTLRGINICLYNEMYIYELGIG